MYRVKMLRFYSLIVSGLRHLAGVQGAEMEAHFTKS